MIDDTLVLLCICSMISLMQPLNFQTFPFILVIYHDKWYSFCMICVLHFKIQRGFATRFSSSYHTKLQMSPDFLINISQMGKAEPESRPSHLDQLHSRCKREQMCLSFLGVKFSKWMTSRVVVMAQSLGDATVKNSYSLKLFKLFLKVPTMVVFILYFFSSYILSNSYHN